MQNKTIQLRGLAWDHERCWGPLEASASQFQTKYPNVNIQWDRRSLWSFGEGNLEELVNDYDLIMIDHPFAGESVNNHYFHDLTQLLPPDFLSDQRQNSTGPSYESYLFDRYLTALPIDAACQVAAYRLDLFEKHQFNLPKTLQDLIALGEQARNKGLYLGYPAIPVDIMCSFLTISANLGYPLRQNQSFIELKPFQKVCDIIRTMLSFAHPDSFHWNPIQCYEYMSQHDDVIYNPLGFGYLNYSKSNREKPLLFDNIVSFANNDNCNGSLLGGAGLAISKRCQHTALAAEYAAFIAGEAYQSTDYVLFGGQAGHAKAWASPNNNAQYGHFFSNTQKTISSAYLRPRFPGFMTFFRNAAGQITAIFTDNAIEEEVWKHLNHSYKLSSALNKQHAVKPGH